MHVHFACNVYVHERYRHNRVHAGVAVDVHSPIVSADTGNKRRTAVWLYEYLI